MSKNPTCSYSDEFKVSRCTLCLSKLEFMICMSYIQMAYSDTIVYAYRDLDRCLFIYLGSHKVIHQDIFYTIF